MQYITITGNLGNDAEFMFTQSGTALLKFNVAVNTGRDDTAKTTWYRVVLFGAKAEYQHGAGRLLKGAKVVVLGRLDVSDYKRKDGTAGYSLEISADTVEVFSAGASGDNGGESRGIDF